MKYYKLIRPDLVTLKDCENEIEAEWYNLLLFASDDVIKSLKEFIQKPETTELMQKRYCNEERPIDKKTSLEPKEIDV